MKQEFGLEIRRQIDERREASTIAIVDAVAEVKGVAKHDLDPLEYTISTDALDQIISADAPTVVSFEYEGHPIVVDSDTVTVYSTATSLENIRSSVTSQRV